MKIRIKKTKFYGILGILVIVGIFLSFNSFMNQRDIDLKRDKFISLKQDIQGNLLPQGNYQCCLEKPCTYCIEKSPGHGKGATCSCLEDIVNGVHPCGECIGEILEGHGNKFLAKYFAKAIAEEVGEQYSDSLKEIISEKYGISVGEQL